MAGLKPAPDDVRWLSAQEQTVWRAFLDVSRLLFEQLGRTLTEGTEISFAEYEVLVHLSEAPERRLRMSELAERSVSSRSRITHTMARMEERGLVRREPCPQDDRGVMGVLTDAGYELLVQAAPAHVAQVRAVMFDPLSTSDVTALGEALLKVRTALRDQ
jgi:DNA-binding MarR family transcriptional regulator